MEDIYRFYGDQVYVEDVKLNARGAMKNLFGGKMIKRGLGQGHNPLHYFIAVVLLITMMSLTGCNRKFMVKKTDLKPPRVMIRQKLTFKTGVQVCKIGVMKRVWSEIDCEAAAEASGIRFNQNLVRPNN